MSGRADGLRGRNENEGMLQAARGYAMELGVSAENIHYYENMNTAWGDMFGQERLHIGTDVLPSARTKVSLSPNERVSMRGAIAHEVVGHREAALAGRTQNEVWAEEAQASLRAAKFAPGLSNKERKVLYLDAMDRLRKADKSLKDASLFLEIR